MTPRPPTSTLFPYTTLFRSQYLHIPLTTGAHTRRILDSALNRGRSEEHTSELQSQSNLVCRLLLEKKKSIARFDDLHVDAIDRQQIARYFGRHTHDVHKRLR